MFFDPDGDLYFLLRDIGTYHIRVSILDSKDQTRQYTSDWITIYGVKQFSQNTGSVFSGGNIWIIIAIIGLFAVVVAACVVVFIRSKKKALAFAPADASEAFENTETFGTPETSETETPEQAESSDTSEQSEPSEPSE